MSKAQDICRSVKVYNDYEFFGNRPYIWRRPSRSRSVIPCGWMITKRGEKLSDDWYNYGDRAFTYSGRERGKEAFGKAKEFLRKRWGITEVKRCPFGAYGDAEFVENRLKEIKELAKKNEEE